MYFGQLRWTALVSPSCHCFCGTELLRQQTVTCSAHNSIYLSHNMIFLSLDYFQSHLFCSPWSKGKEGGKHRVCVLGCLGCVPGEKGLNCSWENKLSCCPTREVSGLYRYWILIQILSLGNLICFVLYISAWAQFFLCLNTLASVSCIKPVRSWGVSSVDFQSSVLGAWFKCNIEQQGQSWKHRLPNSAFAFHM